MSFLVTRRRFFEAIRTPTTAALRHALLFPAVIVTDSVPPSVPQNLVATAVSTTQIDLSWSASTDTGGSGLQGYRIYKNGSGTPLAQQSGRTYSDTNLTAATLYTYRVSAYDTQGNESAQSTQASATTQSEGGLTALQDWNNRSSGAVQAKRFTLNSDITSWTHNDGTQSRVSLDLADGIIGDGCAKITIPSADGASTGQLRFPLNSSWLTDQQGFGSTRFYVQYRCKLGPSRLTPSNGGGGFKVANIAGFKPQNPGSSNSHTGHEIVVGKGFPGGPIFYAYREHPVSGTTPFEESDANGLHLQTAVPAPYCLYLSGNASAACWQFHEQEWFTVYYVVRIADYGGSGIGNEIDIYVARDGETSYTHLYNNRNFRIGSDPDYPLGVNGIWLLNYDTNRTSASYDTWAKYDQLIVKLSPIACPLVAAQAPTTGPTWFASAANRQRITPVTNWIGASGVAGTASPNGSGHQAVYNTYNGAAIDRYNKRIFALRNGGHNNWYGNEAYGVSVGVQSPAWVRLRNTTSFVSNGDRQGSFPSSVHTYITQLCDVNGRVWSPTSQGYNDQGGSNQRALWELTVGTMSNNGTLNPWVDRGDIFPAGGKGAGTVIVLYDPVNNHFLWIGTNDASVSLRRQDCATLAAVGSDNTNQISDGSTRWSAGYDHTNGNILLQGNAGWWQLRIATPTAAWTQPTVSGGGNVDGFMAWHPASNAFLTWGGGQLMKGVPTRNGAGNITSVAWSTVTTTGVSVPSVTSENGINNRLGIIDALGGPGTRDAFVFIPAYSNPDVFIIPLDSGGV